MTKPDRKNKRNAVQQHYKKIAEKPAGGCGPSCCGPAPASSAGLSAQMGYSEAELSLLPGEADMGLGCGNPQAIAELKPGETVLDLGSGGGIDCFLAARQVGAAGFVIGVDMTPEMISKARLNARSGGFQNVEFRLGEIEHIPAADSSVDVIISNCVINLSTEKARVFNEAFRILKPGGRLAISDVVALKEFPPEIREDIELFAGCVSGAASTNYLTGLLRQSGFTEIKIELKDEKQGLMDQWFPGKNITGYIASAYITARKPD